MSRSLYHFLLRLYPARFRQAYGDEMDMVFHDCLREAHRAGPGAVWGLWCATAYDLMITVPRTHREEWMMTTTTYTRSSQGGAAAALLAAATWLGMAGSGDMMSRYGPDGAMSGLTLLCLSVLGVTLALHRRIVAERASRLSTLGWRVALLCLCLVVPCVLAWLGAGIGQNGIFLAGMLGAYLGLLLALSLVGLAALPRTSLGMWRYAPFLTLPLLLSILITSAFLTPEQAVASGIYLGQGVLFASALVGTAVLLWRTARRA